MSFAFFTGGATATFVEVADGSVSVFEPTLSTDRTFHAFVSGGIANIKTRIGTMRVVKTLYALALLEGPHANRCLFGRTVRIVNTRGARLRSNVAETSFRTVAVIRARDARVSGHVTGFMK